MTPQEIFDTAAISVLKQDKPSVEGASCVYRTIDGMRCAVGWLFNSTELSEYGDFQGGIEGVLEADAVRGYVLRPFFQENKDLLSAIQMAHDERASTWNASAGGYRATNDIEGWRSYFIDKMRGIAEEYRLSTVALDAMAPNT
jgi:hypothetical protein